MADPQTAPPLKTWLVSPKGWNTAAESAQNPAAGQAADDEVWAELVRAGVARDDRTLDPMWQAVINQSLTAQAVFRVASTYNGLAYLADISLGREVTTCLTRRLRVEDDGSGALVATGADPQLEFVVTRPDQPWQLIRRVLPPLEELRAEPRQTRDAERVEYPLDPATIEQIRASLATPGLAPAARDALNAKATVMLMTLVAPPAGATDKAPGVGLKAWALGENGLYSLEPQRDGATVAKVSPGDIGFAVLWYTLGAKDAMAFAERIAGGAQS